MRIRERKGINSIQSCKFWNTGLAQQILPAGIELSFDVITSGCLCTEIACTEIALPVETQGKI